MDFDKFNFYIGMNSSSVSVIICLSAYLNSPHLLQLENTYIQNTST